MHMLEALAAAGSARSRPWTKPRAGPGGAACYRFRPLLDSTIRRAREPGSEHSTRELCKRIVEGPASGLAVSNVRP